MALGALSAVQARGIRIPEEFGVVGCDDIPEASFFMPSLTTLHQPFAEYGRIIIQSLLQMIEQAHKGETVIQPETRLIRPSLVVRGSSSRK
jgi:DNA-binding LacI/PurR family transcriptional regulator